MDTENAKNTSELSLITSNPSKSSLSVNKPIPYTFDLGNLLCNDPTPLPSSPSPSILASTARDSAQALINQLLTTCPIHTSSTDGALMTLPPPTTPLPREKMVPAEKEKTKWERFAAKKGIKDKKRGEGKVVFDEEKGEWVPKWGYKGRNKEGEGEWIVEVDEKRERKREEEGKEGTVRGERRRERVEKVKRNERKQRANDRKGRKGGGGG
ncbi:Rhodanese- sulfurtransferase [Puttea exsequens]|nr:Rhodanese- sulfurtransferase [Puttea exsequens]